MKRLIYILLSLSFISAFGQDKRIDSLNTAYAEANTDSDKVKILSNIADLYAQSHPDSELYKAQQALLISHRIKFINGELWSLKQMAEAYQFMGNYPLALQYYLKRLQLDEENPNPEREMVTLLGIANLYELEGDYKQALYYANKSTALAERFKLEQYRWYSYISFGDLYEKTGNIPKAEYYNEQAYQLAISKKNEGWMGMCLNNIGNTYIKANEYSKAFDSYKKGLPFLQKDNNDSFLCETYQGIAKAFSHFGKLDSAIYYGKRALKLAKSRRLSSYYLQSCKLLTHLYETGKQADSALVYQGRLLVMKDSIYSQEKVKQMESLTIAERLRQKERILEKQQEEEERVYKMNMLLIGLFIPLFFLISVFLSKRKIKRRVVEFSGILSLLMLFEYLTLLLHPIIGDFTGHSPLYEIIILVTIAAVLTPTHHRLEHWMIHQLTHKHPASQNTTVVNETTQAKVEEEKTEKLNG
jgi:tetratricopeptide (TPR) repeat protein